MQGANVGSGDCTQYSVRPGADSMPFPNSYAGMTFRPDPRSAGRPPTVVHLTSAHDPRDPRISRKQCATLRDAGYDVRLVAPNAGIAAVDGVPVLSIPAVGDRYSRIRRLLPLLRVAHSLNADAYHLHDPELLLIGWMLKKQTGAAIVYDMHEDYQTRGAFVGRLIRLMERWAFGWLDAVVLAEERYAPVLAGTSVPSVFIGNYHKPVTDAPSHPLPEALPDVPTLLYTGSVSPRRGLTAMLRATAALHEAGIPASLTLGGICRSAAHRHAAERFLQQHNLQDAVRREGWSTYLPASDMAPLYRHADVGLALFEPHPNYVKSLPTKFFEYLHHGLPIIATDVPLWRRFIETHACGAVVPEGRPQAVVEVVRHWQTHPAAYRACADAARRAAPQYRWEAMRPRLLDLYERVLASSP